MASNNYRDTSKPGLEWEERVFGTVPKWTREPDMSIIQDLAMSRLHLDSNTPCEVSFYAEGVFNKLYKISHIAGTWLMRVALPVDPYYKTASEAATLDFIRKHTTIPAPAIIARDSSLNGGNALGFEWMIMEFMPGRPLRYAWRQMTMEAKVTLVKQLARYQSELESKQFSRIGNLYHYMKTQDFDISRVVSIPFFWKDRTATGAHGPFATSLEWLSAQLALIIEEKERVLEESKDRTDLDEDDLDDLEEMRAGMEIGRELLSLLPELLKNDSEMTTVLHHDDLQEMNILTDKEGKLTAIVDWECVSAVPLWRARQIPKLLEGRTRDEEPAREKYQSAEGDIAARMPGYEPEPEPELKDEGMGEIYWEHMMEYDLGKLRPVFVDEMERLVPGWRQDCLEGEAKRDVEQAIKYIDGDMILGRVGKWLGGITSGDRVTFSELEAAWDARMASGSY